MLKALWPSMKANFVIGRDEIPHNHLRNMYSSFWYHIAPGLVGKMGIAPSLCIMIRIFANEVIYTKEI